MYPIKRKAPAGLHSPYKKEKNTVARSNATQHTSEQTMIQRSINREIQETPNGSRTVKETETSTTNTQSFKILYETKVKTAMEILSCEDPGRIITHSHIARELLNAIENNRTEFYTLYPTFVLKGTQTDPVMWQAALSTFASCPLVDFSWKEIVATGFALVEEDVVSILLNKLVWKAAMSHRKQEEDSLVAAVNDKEVHVSLTNFDCEKACAKVRLKIPSEKVDVSLEIQHVDPFLLMLLPDPVGKARVRSMTECLAHQALATL